jgi:hypothetical protein
MGSLPLRQSDAARWTKAAWAATALAGAAAVIIFVLPGSKVTVDPNSSGNAGQPATPEKVRVHPTENLGPQNWAALSTTMLALQGNQPELEQWWRTVEARRLAAAQAAETEAGETPGAPGTTADARFAPTWRFIGLMWNGLTPLAIIQVDGTQKLAGVGDKPVTNDEFVIDSIDAERIVVSRRGSKYEIKREVSERGTTLTDASALVDPNEGVFGDQTGAGRRAPTMTRPRNNRQ